MLVCFVVVVNYWFVELIVYSLKLIYLVLVNCVVEFVDFCIEDEYLDI